MAKPQCFNFNPLTCGVIDMREMALLIDQQVLRDILIDKLRVTYI